MTNARGELPKWVDIGLIPVLNLTVAMLVAGLVVIIIGENPLEALAIMLKGALGSIKGWSYTLYYATSFIFTGLAVAVALHAGQFNIGGEGQAYMGGLGAALIGIGLAFLPSYLLLPVTILACAAFGAMWGWLPGVLYAKRGSHIVITTIMLNYIAASLIAYIISNYLRPLGNMAVESKSIDGAYILSFREIARMFDVKLPNTPLNLSIFLALFTAWAVWYLLWRTKLGYEIRAVGASTSAAIYAGIKPGRTVVIAMTISGGIAGLVAANEILGVQHRLVLEFVGGAGYVGIAVALMGRSHPLGIILASLLFGVLYQGGTELSFAKPAISREMIVVIQGFVVLFMGALENSFRPALATLFFKSEG